MRMGKCKLNFYKVSINKHENGLCDCCHETETIEHYLLVSKKYVRERIRLFSRLKIKDKSLKNLLGNEDRLHTLLAFIKATGRYQSL